MATVNNEPDAVCPDGEGGDSIPRWELATERQGVRNRWNIPDEERDAIVARQIAIAKYAEKDRDATSAAKCLASMDAQNMEQEKRDDPRQQSGVTVNIQNNDNRVSINDRRAELTGIIAAALDRARSAAGGGTTDAADDAQRAVPQPVDD